MKVLLTIRSDAERNELEQALVAQASSFVEAACATRAAVDVRAGGEEHEQLAPADTEQDVSAVVALWDVASAEAALGFPLPEGASLVGGYRVEEVVQNDYERTWPPGETSPGVKLFCFVRRRPDLSHEEHSRHWRENHGPLAVARQPGFWHYVQNHIVERLTDATPELDGLGEIHYKSAESVFTETYDSDEGQRLIEEDMARFLHPDGTNVLVSKETLVGP